MITVRKKLKGVVPYTLIFFPEDSALEEMADRLPAIQVTRVEAASLDLEHGRCIVDHHLCLTLAVDLTRRVDELYKNVAANARIRIHKAERLGSRVTIRRCSADTGYDKALVDEFRALYNQLAIGKRGIAVPISRATAERFRANTDLMLAYLDGELICGHFNLIDKHKGISRLLYSANRRFEERKTARLSGILNCYLHWYEILKYREEGLTSYDFGTIGQIEDGLGVNRFKMQFGGDIMREHNYLLAGMPRLSRTALKLKTSLTQTGRRRQQMERAGDRWRFMPIEQIRSVVERSIHDYEKSLASRSRKDLRDDTQQTLRTPELSA
jgi:hypothetical protein